eukprot:CAMPEP_0185769808 /NCGR_PEP_ID=MMETSP1174-20130828/55980_1 /TAXON_ID=35687 /ORGANISM="Dictyocha speculum, Strain CCMP1381" /LENGTH=203 /DNA_ID=CAMNT_0028455011 /DNA_START=608 /DNA_END=1220 /DNA_ORIENTATION=+
MPSQVFQHAPIPCPPQPYASVEGARGHDLPRAIEPHVTDEMRVCRNHVVALPLTKVPDADGVVIPPCCNLDPVGGKGPAHDPLNVTLHGHDNLPCADVPAVSNPGEVPCSDEGTVRMAGDHVHFLRVPVLEEDFLAHLHVPQAPCRVERCGGEVTSLRVEVDHRQPVLVPLQQWAAQPLLQSHKIAFPSAEPDARRGVVDAAP